jgi:uncharacterized delta-60 repeat protein
MKGSLIINFDSVDFKGGDYYNVKVNNQNRYIHYNTTNNLYNTFLQDGDVVNITSNNNCDWDVVRKDFTTDDQGGDQGIRNTTITGVSNSTGVTFTASTIPQNYNFHYIIGVETLPPPSGNCMTIGTGFTSQAANVLQQSTGKYIVGGGLSRYSGQTISGVTRLNTSGTLDSTYTQNSLSIGSIFGAMYVNNDDSIVVGSFTGPIWTAKYNSNGTVDTGFTQLNKTVPADNVGLLSMDKQSNGKYLVGGQFRDLGSGAGENYKALGRLNSNGTIDTTFNTGLTVSTIGFGNAATQIRKIYVLPDDKFFVSGDWALFKNILFYKRGFMKFNADGTEDTSFANGAFSGAVTGFDLQSDGKIICLNGTSYSGQSINRICRLNTDGTLDNTFITGITGNPALNDVVVQPNDKIIVVGRFADYNGPFGKTVGMFRLNSDGSLDTSFTLTAINALGNFQRVILDQDGGIAAVGNFDISTVTPTINDFAKFDNNGNLITNNC